MLGVLKRRWKPRRSPRRGASRGEEAEQCEEAPPPSRGNLRVAGGRIEFAPPPPELADAAAQTDAVECVQLDERLAERLEEQLEAQAAQLAKLQRQVARGREERELRVRAEAARAQADHTKMAALGRALRKEKLRGQAQAQQAAAAATTAEARWLQAQASSRRLAQENLSLRAQLEHCCAASEALCGGLASARRENAGLRAAAARSERCLEDVARTVLQALVAQAHLRQRIARIDKQPRALRSQDSLTWDCGDSSAGDGDACADTPCAADLSAGGGGGDDGYSTMSPDLPRPPVAGGHPPLPALREEPPPPRLRHSFPPAGRPRPLAARSLPASAAASAVGPAWPALSDWSMSSEERLSGSGSSDWSCQPGVDFTRDFYRLVRFGSQRSLASRGGAGGGAWPGQAMGGEDVVALFCGDGPLGRDARELRLSLEADTLGEYLREDSLYLDDGPYFDADGCYLNRDCSYQENLSFVNEDGSYLEEDSSYFEDGGTFMKVDDSFLRDNRPYMKEDCYFLQEGPPLIKESEFTQHDDQRPYMKEDIAFILDNRPYIKEDISVIRDEVLFIKEAASPLQEDQPCIKEVDSSRQEEESFGNVEESCQQEVTLRLECGEVNDESVGSCIKEVVDSEDCLDNLDNGCQNDEEQEQDEPLQGTSQGDQHQEHEEMQRQCHASRSSQREGSSDSDGVDGNTEVRVDAYQRLHRLHKVRRHRKADAVRGQRLRAAPARASILERAVFTRFGPAEQDAVARFDFLCTHDEDPLPTAGPAHSAHSSSSSSRSSGSSSQWEYVALDDNAQWEEPGGSNSQWARVESSEESSEEVTQQLSLSDSC